MAVWFPVDAAVLGWACVVAFIILIVSAIAYAANKSSRSDAEAAFSSHGASQKVLSRAMGFPVGYEGIFSQRRLDTETGRAWALTPGQLSVALCLHSSDRKPQIFFSYLNDDRAVSSSIFLHGQCDERWELRFDSASVIFNFGGRVFYAPVGFPASSQVEWLRVSVAGTVRELTSEERSDLATALDFVYSVRTEKLLS